MTATLATQGIGSHGITRQLGETDSDGRLVGFIDADGSCYESRAERDCAIGAGMLCEAWRAWVDGGMIGTAPDTLSVLNEARVAPEHRRTARTEFHEQLAMIRMLARDKRWVVVAIAEEPRRYGVPPLPDAAERRSLPELLAARTR